MSLFTPALRCIGNFMTTNDCSIIERCLWLGILDKLFQLLFTSSTQMIKEALWVISNITAGPANHVDSVVKSDLFERICVLTESKNLEIRKEALFVLCNGITGADVVVVGEIYQKTQGRLIKILIDATNVIEKKLTMTLLDSIEAVLKLDEWLGTRGTDKSICLLFEHMNGIEALEELQKHPDIKIYQRAAEILKSFFETDDRMDLEQHNNFYNGQRTL